MAKKYIRSEFNMAKITMLGTGNGSTIKLYNTCFVIENNNQKF